MSVPFEFVAVRSLSEATVAGPYGTMIPGGVSLIWAAAPRVQMPSADRLVTPIAGM